MNIGIILYGFPPEVVGGAEIQGKALAIKLSSKNHKITVFTGSKSNEIIDENPNLRIIKIKYMDTKILRVFIAQLVAFLPRIKREAHRFDVLLCYQVNPPGIIGLFSKFIFKKPLITWIRAKTEYTSLIRRYFFTSILLKYSDRFVVQTPRIRKEIFRIYSGGIFISKSSLEGIAVIPNGIEINDSRGTSYKERNGIIYVGRLHEDKGIEYLIAAMKGIDEKLTIIGDGPEKNALMELAKGSMIEFKGELNHEEVLDHMEKSKLLVLPSLGEALPNVVLEAMSVGSPVVSTNVGGIPDILENGKTGLLVEPKDVQGLRKHIQFLLGDEKIWQEMHNNCINEVKKYSWNKVVTDVEKLLAEVL